MFQPAKAPFFVFPGGFVEDGPELTAEAIQEAEGTGPIQLNMEADADADAGAGIDAAALEEASAETEADGEEAAASAAAAPKTLAQLRAENPDLQREYEESVAADRAEAVRQREETLRTQQRNQEWNQLQNWRNQQMTTRQYEDWQHNALLQSDPIGEAERWAGLQEKRRGEDAQYENLRAGHQQKYAQDLLRGQVQQAEQQAFARAFDVFYRNDMDPDLQKLMANKTYPGTYQEGYIAWLRDFQKHTDQRGYERGLQAGIDQERNRGRSERTRELSQAGLAEPRPDISARAGGAGGNVIPSEAELNQWTYEQKQAALAKDPFFYDKVYARAGSRR